MVRKHKTIWKSPRLQGWALIGKSEISLSPSSRTIICWLFLALSVGLFSKEEDSREWANRASSGNRFFSKPCLCLSDTRHFRHFRPFQGSEERSPCFFFFVSRMQIRHFRRLRQNGPLLEGNKNTVSQKHGLCHPDFGNRASVKANFDAPKRLQE